MGPPRLRHEAWPAAPCGRVRVGRPVRWVCRAARARTPSPDGCAGGRPAAGRLLGTFRRALHGRLSAIAGGGCLLPRGRIPPFEHLHRPRTRHNLHRQAPRRPRHRGQQLARARRRPRILRRRRPPRAGRGSGHWGFPSGPSHRDSRGPAQARSPRSQGLLCIDQGPQRHPDGRPTGRRGVLVRAGLRLPGVFDVLRGPAAGLARAVQCQRSRRGPCRQEMGPSAGRSGGI